MKRCRFSALAAGLILSGSLCLSGCSVGLKDAYSLKERVPSIEASFAAEDEAAKGFASDLCVISDEGSFDPEDVTSQAGALFDLTDREVLYSKDAFEKMYPASITKVMTSLIAIKYGNLEDQVTVTEDAVISESGATLCGIKPGDTLTLEQLLYGLMLPSGNDAGAAIAIHMAGSIDAFADMMNEEAKRLGATDTHFMNPHGLHDEDHYTTAYDLYLIFNEALKYPEFRTVTGSTAYTANYTNGANFPLRYMLLGLSPTGKNEAFTHPYENGYPSQGIWGWECTFTVDNFRRILNGRTPVVYPEVTEYYGDIFTYPYSADNTTGKTVYKYDIYDILANDTLFFEAPQYYGNNLSYTPKKYRYNILKEKTDYVYENQSYRIIRQEINEWYKIYQGIQNYQYTNAYHTDHAPANASLYPFFTTKFYYLGSTLLTSRKVKTYAQKVYTDAYYYVTEKENYTYNVRGQLIEKILSGYKSGNIKTAYTYPVISTNGTTSAVIQDMVNKNIISPVLEERISSDLLSSSSSAFRNISGTKAEYGIFNVGSSTLYLPSKLYELNRFSISDYVLSNEVFSYSEQGNLREVVSKDGVHTVYLWSYKDRYLIAEIKNATSSQVSAAVSSVFGMTIDALSQVAVPDVTKLKSLRKNTNLKDAFVSTFTYQPLVGVTSMTDPSGMTTYYNYDGLGKLVETYYYEGNVVSSDKKRTLQQYEYHYRNQ